MRKCGANRTADTASSSEFRVAYTPVQSCPFALGRFPFLQVAGKVGRDELCHRMLFAAFAPLVMVGGMSNEFLIALS